MINIRTEKKLGPNLSETFQSFSHGPEIDGRDCELNQIENLLKIDLNPFTLRNYSGMWDENDFPPDDKDKLLKKQLEEDRIWNDLTEFLNLVKLLITYLETKSFSYKKISHKLSWWDGYFHYPLKNDKNDSFYKDLKTMEDFLIYSKKKGETKTAFYVQ